MTCDPDALKVGDTVEANKVLGLVISVQRKRQVIIQWLGRTAASDPVKYTLGDWGSNRNVIAQNVTVVPSPFDLDHLE